MFDSEDPGFFFGGESEQWDEGVTEYRGNEFGSGGTISEFGRDNPGIDNGGVIEGGIDSARPGDTTGSGGGTPDGTVGGQAQEEEETSVLVEQAEDNEELNDYIVSVLERIEQEIKDGSIEESSEVAVETSDTDADSANKSLYTIDDVYSVLGEIKTSCLEIRDDSKSYHVGQDITGRMLVAVLFMILGGIVIYAFVGRIR